MPYRDRKPSDASSLVSSTSSRPSTSSRSDLSVDWDPLRLHPPLAPGPAPPLPDTFGESRQYTPHEIRRARSSHNLSSLRNLRGYCSTSQLDYQSASETVIYDGFDFGFEPKPAAAAAAALNHDTSVGGRRTRRRDPSPAPSVASSSASSIVGRSDSVLEAGLMVGLAPAPQSRPRSRPRPHSPEPGSALDDEAEYFIRRGGWKRRGIVFVDSGPPLAGEDNIFGF
ncbi:hypothetical protein VTK56DRAFT_2182 [Thermocarpiscus australiensis]